MKTSDFSYDLPKESIAQKPLEPRDASRLMVLHREEGRLEHRHFRDIGDYLRAGDVLVANDSRVIPARLFGRKVGTGGQVELLLLKREDDRVWEALVKPGHRVKPGTEVELIPCVSEAGSNPKVRVDQERITVRVTGCGEAGTRMVEFPQAVNGDLDSLGTVPLPPYIHEPLGDPERYQTIYARMKGSVAAPTAGLHFTPELISALRANCVDFAFVTLHIGLDTFRPVHEEELEEHAMHSEWCELGETTAARLNRARAEGGRIIAVGTTAVRVLETASQKQTEDSGDQGGRVQPFRGWTRAFIYPGYRFRAVDALITNFHLPRSTLLMLVSAFAGKSLIDRAYTEAIREGYRFYSFGDASFMV